MTSDWHILRRHLQFPNNPYRNDSWNWTTRPCSQAAKSWIFPIHIPSQWLKRCSNNTVIERLFLLDILYSTYLYIFFFFRLFVTVNEMRTFRTLLVITVLYTTCVSRRFLGKCPIIKMLAKYNELHDLPACEGFLSHGLRQRFGGNTEEYGYIETICQLRNICYRCEY